MRRLRHELHAMRARVAELEAWNDAAERAGEALRRSDESFRRIFDHSNDGIFIVDPDRDCIVDVNGRACSMVGFTREELLATPVSALHPEESHKLIQFARDVRAQGSGWTSELACVTKSGRRIATEISASVLDLVSRKYLIVLVRDISARKQAEEELVRANRRMRSDLEAAARIQESLRPSPELDLPGIDVAWEVHPSERLGGDLFDVYAIDEDRVGLYVVDVSGHGVAAAMLSIALHRVLSPPRNWNPLLAKGARRAPSRLHIASPAELCDRLNRLFPMNAVTSQYFTLVYGVYHRPSRLFRFASAGHSPPIVATPDAPAREVVVPGYPIGVMNDAEFEEHTLLLPPGSRLYLYSDGITDVFGENGEAFGEERLRDSLDSGRSVDLRACVAGTVERARAWHTGSGPTDDITLVALEAKR
jgi:sigma-B regulation protein RsbU (phosphoserine phosphatase)